MGGHAPFPARHTGTAVACGSAAGGSWYLIGGSEMAFGVAPIRVDVETDALISDAAHFLDQSKKDVVDAAVREYIENHRDEINAGVRAALAQLDGTKGGGVSMLTGFDAAKLAELGGGGE